VNIPPLVEMIRRFRPQVVTTYDEFGGYPHPDHIRTHETTITAIDAAADAAYRPDLGAPWKVLKVYYNHQFTRSRVLALHQAMLDARLSSPYVEWLDRWNEDRDMFVRVTTRVDASDFFDTRDAALLAHRTQIDPEGMWFAVPMDMQRRVWPTDDFELVRSEVPVTFPEDDLFSGLRQATSIPTGAVMGEDAR
jgi:mycothiol S-conjugate amidase